MRAAGIRQGRGHSDSIAQAATLGYRLAARVIALSALAFQRSRSLVGDCRRRRQIDNHMARVIHDLRQPLTTLSASVELLAFGAPESPHIERCRRAIRQQRQLIDDLLVLEGHIEVAEMIDVGALVAELLDDLQPYASIRQVELVLGGRAQATVRGNRLGLRRALANVVANAIEMTRERSRVEILMTRRRASVAIEVRDQGPGLAPELRERVFDPFFTTRVRGTGLGLAITRAVVVAHHGNVRFIDAPGGCVRLELPCPQSEAARPPSLQPVVRRARVAAR